MIGEFIVIKTERFCKKGLEDCIKIVTYINTSTNNKYGIKSVSVRANHKFVSTTNLAPTILRKIPTNALIC